MILNPQLLNLISVEKSRYFQEINLKSKLEVILTKMVSKLGLNNHQNLHHEHPQFSRKYQENTTMNIDILNRPIVQDILVDSNTMENIDQYPINILHNIALSVRKLYRKIYYQNIRIRQLQQENRKLKELAFLDDLTQLANRRKFYLYMEHTLPSQKGQPISLILLDIDFFKPYNDNYGHLAGDLCLPRIAKAIQEAITASHKQKPYLAARYGGEEFAIILPGLKLKEALNVANQIRLKVLAKNIPHCGSEIGSCITLSAGVASQIIGDDLSPEDLILSADRGLDQAKNSGRNRVLSES
ncbi:diguanylate cyclase [Limnospira sp. PMC 1245.20]|nr:diguanylate cyclase [Limnospira sp. PMC 1245.20]MDT9196098.1 diguanylate cyclase [Limnospira sp. PMC 1245.20]